ncbi:MAG TPA: helix-turn-helix transcriptional regulator [Casimicrobiaceae bacterium]
MNDRGCRAGPPIRRRVDGPIRAQVRPNGRWARPPLRVSIFANHPKYDYVRALPGSDEEHRVADKRARQPAFTGTRAGPHTSNARRGLIAARTAVGMTQDGVAARMGTTTSAVSRLESGVRTRPTLRTIENYALAVGARVEIRVRR